MRGSPNKMVTAKGRSLRDADSDLDQQVLQSYSRASRTNRWRAVRKFGMFFALSTAPVSNHSQCLRSPTLPQTGDLTRAILPSLIGSQIIQPSSYHVPALTEFREQ